MLQVIAYAVIASAALPIGALAGARLKIPKPVLAMMLGFASGALVSAVAFELFDEAFEYGGAVALLVAIFVSNFPEALVGAEKMKEAGISAKNAVLIWLVAAVLLAIAVVVGYLALDGASGKTLSLPLAFAAGAVLASLADTVMPEAYAEGGIKVAYATALGFLLSYLLSAG
jgi:ZIP family zinc transporter